MKTTNITDTYKEEEGRKDESITISNEGFDGHGHIEITIENRTAVLTGDVYLDDLLAALEGFKEERKLSRIQQKHLKN